MMRLALALAVTLALASHAEAIPATCLALPLPTSPLAPNFTLNFLKFGGEAATGTFWRQPCTDGSGEVAVLIRLTATSGNPFVCGGIIVQNGIQRDGRFITATSPPAPSFCGDLFVPTTVILISGLFEPDYDERAAFTFIHDGGSPVTSIEIPAAGPPPPPPPAVLTLTVHPLGCTTCHPGNTLGFELHVTNPGAPVLVELKTGARLPGGAVVSILGRHEEEVLASGVTVIPLFSGFVLPAGIPAGAYVIEAALLEPELGVTISRHSVPLTLGP